MNSSLVAFAICTCALAKFAVYGSEYHSPRVLHELRKKLATVIAPSPGGHQVLSWGKFNEGDDREGLVVSDASTGVATHFLRSSMPVMRCCWSPDGRYISYFKTSAYTEDRTLFIWDIAEDHHRSVDIPKSHTQPLIRWSPDSSKIAFNGAPNGFTVVSVTGGQTANYGRKVFSFDWSDDSHLIATIEQDQAGRVVKVFDVQTGRVSKIFKLAELGEPQEVAWQRSGSVLIRSKEILGLMSGPVEISRIVSMDPATGKKKSLYTSRKDIRDPLWLPAGAGYLWHQNEPGEDGKLAIMLVGSAKPRFARSAGELNFREFDSANRRMIAWELTPDINHFVAISFNGEVQSEPFPNHAMRVAGVSFKHQRIFPKGRTPLDILVATRGQTPHSNAVVIRVRWGDRISLSGIAWAETQVLMDYGLAYVQLPNRGAGFASDLIAVLDYASKVLKVSRERIVIYASSEGGTQVVETLLRTSAATGPLVLVGFAGFDSEVLNSVAGKPRTSFPILAFHGANDSGLPPDRAKMLLHSAFGPEAMRPPNGVWHVFPGEGHSPRRDESHALVITETLRALKVLEE